MLPAVLQSSYKTYKEDTSYIATWLANTAKQCGYSADLLDRHDAANPSKPTQLPKRLKGKARKKAKDAATAGVPPSSTATTSPATTQSSMPTYTIKIKDFISLAEYVVGSTKPLVSVPGSLVKALNRAIALRKDHGSASESSDAPDESHAHFLAVLEKTREILKPRSPTEMVNDRLTRPISEDGSGESKNDEMLNRFQGLGLEEPSQNFLDAPDVKPASRSDTERMPKYEVETEKSRMEEYLATHCLLQDVRNIRGFVCALWKNNQEGMDICAVAVTVNTAIDFVRTLEQDLVRQYPAMRDYESIIDLFDVAQCLNRGQQPGHKQRPGDIINMAVYDLAEDLMIPTASILGSLQEVIQDGSVPQYKPGFLGYRDMSTPWSQKSPRDKIQDDRLVMMEAFPDLVLLSMITSRYPLAEDELMRGIRQMSPGKDIPLWLVFAAQCFLDAQHELKGDVSSGHEKLRNTANSIKASIETNMKFHQKLRVVNWPESNDMQFTEMIRVITDWVGQDVIADKWAKVFRRSILYLGYPINVTQVQRRRVNIPIEPFNLLRQYPVMCGLFSFALKMRYQELQIVFVNAWGSLMYTAQLYNACRQERLLPKMWKDMELVISLQGPNKFFVGDAPKGLEEYLKRYLLSMGYSAALLAENRRKNANAVSAKGPRCLTELCAVSKLFAGRYCNNDPAVSWTPETIKPIIEAKLEETSDEEPASPPMKENIGGETRMPKKTKESSKPKKAKQSSSGSLLRKPKRSGNSIPTNDFLLDLANALHTESMEMNLDYLRIHRFCWMLLRAVNEACKPRLLQTYGSGYLERENQLPFVVGYIFMAATMTSKIAGVLIPRKEGVEVSSKLLMTAAETLDGMLGGGAGGTETTILEPPPTPAPTPPAPPPPPISRANCLPNLTFEPNEMSDTGPLLPPRIPSTADILIRENAEFRILSLQTTVWW